MIESGCDLAMKYTSDTERALSPRFFPLSNSIVQETRRTKDDLYQLLLLTIFRERQSSISQIFYH